MQCFEDRADPPLQKENANFCDFFSPAAQAFKAKTADKSDAAKAQLNTLFEQEPPEPVEPQFEDPNNLEHTEPPAPLSKEELAKQKLDDLFN